MAKTSFKLKPGMGNSGFNGAIVIEDGKVRSAAIITWGRQLGEGEVIDGNLIKWQGYDLDTEKEIAIDSSEISEVVITNSFETETKGINGYKTVNYCILR